MVTGASRCEAGQKRKLGKQIAVRVCIARGSSGREPGEDQLGIPPIAVRSPKPRARLESTTPSLAEPRWRQPPPRSPPENQSADAANFSVVRDRLELMAAEVTTGPSATKPCWSDSRSSPP